MVVGRHRADGSLPLLLLKSRYVCRVAPSLSETLENALNLTQCLRKLGVLMAKRPSDGQKPQKEQRRSRLPRGSGSSNYDHSAEPSRNLHDIASRFMNG